MRMTSQTKNIKNLHEIKTIVADSDKKVHSIHTVYAGFNTAKLRKHLGSFKAKGRSVTTILFDLLIMTLPIKVHLALGKVQSRDFDIQIASFTCVFLVYIMGSLRRRFSAFESMGDLFRKIESEILEITLTERLWGLFVELQHMTCTQLPSKYQSAKITAFS